MVEGCAVASVLGVLEAAEIDLDRRVIAREDLVEALAVSAAESAAVTTAGGGSGAGGALRRRQRPLSAASTGPAQARLRRAAVLHATLFDMSKGEERPCCCLT